MPTYTMMHKETGEEKDLFCSYEESLKFLEENPNWSRVIGAPALVSSTGNVINKTSGDWKDLMKNIKKGSGKGNNIKT